MRDKNKEFIKLIKQHIHTVDPGAEVILYGSRARGDERPDSDWDILVLTDDHVAMGMEHQLREKLYDLELDSGESISLFVYSRHDWQTRQKISPFYHNVLLEGVRI